MFFKSVRKGLVSAPSTLLAGLDISTSKVACCVARQTPEGLRVLGTGQHATRGVKAGAIVDMTALEGAVRSAVNQAEEMADETVREIYISVSGGLARSISLRAETQITGHAVDDSDLKKILNQASSASEDSTLDTLHAIPMNYAVDDTKGIHDPRGMLGDVLQGNILLVRAPHSPLQNIAACVERCHLDIAGFVMAPYASGLATLVEDELDLGVTVLEMGAGSTSIALFFDGSLVHLDAIPVGGHHVTHDIARGLSTPVAQAERIKTLYGSAMLSSSKAHEQILVPQIGEEEGRGQQVSKNELIQIIRPRIEETFELVKEKLTSLSMAKKTGQRLVLTGGASQLPGVRELSELILTKQARLGKPIHLKGYEDRVRLPAFATCAGLISYGALMRGGVEDTKKTVPEKRNDNTSKINRFGAWIRENI